MNVHTTFVDLLEIGQLHPVTPEMRLPFTGGGPMLPSKHKLGAIMSLGMMGAAAAAQILYRMRDGKAQDLSVDILTAAWIDQSAREIR